MPCPTCNDGEFEPGFERSYAGGYRIFRYRPCHGAEAHDAEEIVLNDDGVVVSRREHPRCIACRAWGRWQHELARGRVAAAKKADAAERWPVPFSFRAAKLDSPVSESMGDTYERLRSWAQRVRSPDSRSNGVVIVGGAGAGKSHSAVAAANYLASHALSAIAFGQVSVICRRVASAWRSRDESSAEKLVSYLAGIDVLILDDLGKQSPSDANQALLFELVDRRINGSLPTIITANDLQAVYSQFDDDKRPAFKSRLSSFETIPFEGVDLRQSAASFGGEGEFSL